MAPNDQNKIRQTISLGIAAHVGRSIFWRISRAVASPFFLTVVPALVALVWALVIMMTILGNSSVISRDITVTNVEVPLPVSGIPYSELLMPLSSCLKASDCRGLAAQKTQFARAIPAASQKTPSGIVIGYDRDPELAFLEVKVATVIEHVNPKISMVRRLVLARLVARTAAEVFEKPEERLAWISVPATETRFNGTRVSPTGALGIAQTMPAWKDEFAADCGMGETITDADLRDDATNLLVSACHFRVLLKKNHGNYAMAWVGYNAGQYGDDHKNAGRLTGISRDAANYVTINSLIYLSLVSGDYSIFDEEARRHAKRPLVGNKKVHTVKSGALAGN